MYLNLFVCNSDFEYVSLFQNRQCDFLICSTLTRSTIFKHYLYRFLCSGVNPSFTYIQLTITLGSIKHKYSCVYLPNPCELSEAESQKNAFWKASFKHSHESAECIDCVMRTILQIKANLYFVKLENRLGKNRDFWQRRFLKFNY